MENIMIVWLQGQCSFFLIVSERDRPFLAHYVYGLWKKSPNSTVFKE